jgi:hypothetical protein
MPTLINPNSYTVTVRDLNLIMQPGQSQDVFTAQVAASWDLGQALEQGQLVFASGGGWRLENGRISSVYSIQAPITVTAGSGVLTDAFWTGSYDTVRVYFALMSGDLTWSYTSSVDGGSTWFSHNELTSVQLSATGSGPVYNSYLIENLGVMGQLECSTVSGATFAARVALKS